MMHLQMSISDKQYQYLRHQANSRGQSVDALVADWIDAEMAWQETLAADPNIIIPPSPPREPHQTPLAGRPG
jgi:hypothetical protein